MDQCNWIGACRDALDDGCHCRRAFWRLVIRRERQRVWAERQQQSPRHGDSPQCPGRNSAWPNVSPRWVGVCLSEVLLVVAVVWIVVSAVHCRMRVPRGTQRPNGFMMAGCLSGSTCSTQDDIVLQCSETAPHGVRRAATGALWLMKSCFIPRAASSIVNASSQCPRGKCCIPRIEQMQ